MQFSRARYKERIFGVYRDVVAGNDLNLFAIVLGVFTGYSMFTHKIYLWVFVNNIFVKLIQRDAC